MHRAPALVALECSWTVPLQGGQTLCPESNRGLEASKLPANGNESGEPALCEVLALYH